MPNTATNNIVIDPAIMSEADSILGRMGMNLNTAVNVFVRQVIQEQAIPFRIQIATSDTQARENVKAALKAMQEESVKNGTSEMTMEEINAEIAACRQERRAKS
jgi:addiction module RelB/DinJ family antitoxin